MTVRPGHKARRTPNGARVGPAAMVFAALCNENRLRIMVMLDAQGDTRVSVLASTLGLQISHTSQQLKVLRDSGLVRCVAPGAYAVADHAIWAAVRALVVSDDPVPP